MFHKHSKCFINILLDNELNKPHKDKYVLHKNCEAQIHKQIDEEMHASLVYATMVKLYFLKLKIYIKSCVKSILFFRQDFTWRWNFVSYWILHKTWYQ